jgi:hypothetical protein
MEKAEYKTVISYLALIILAPSERNSKPHTMLNQNVNKGGKKEI